MSIYIYGITALHHFPRLPLRYHHHRYWQNSTKKQVGRRQHRSVLPLVTSMRVVLNKICRNCTVQTPAVGGSCVRVCACVKLHRGPLCLLLDRPELMIISCDRRPDGFNGRYQSIHSSIDRQVVRQIFQNFVGIQIYIYIYRCDRSCVVREIHLYI